MDADNSPSNQESETGVEEVATEDTGQMVEDTGQVVEDTGQVVEDTGQMAEDLTVQPVSGMDPTINVPSDCSELADLANLEKIAKAAATAIQQQAELEPPSRIPSEFDSSRIPSEFDSSRIPSEFDSSRIHPDLESSRIHPELESQSGENEEERIRERMQQQTVSTAMQGSSSSCSPPILIPSSHSPPNSMSSMSLMAMVTQSTSPKGSTGHSSQIPSQLQSQQSYPGMPDSHMTMMHSRNSCKTLKCPKCNWHYKYQETLEIHMKEKHPENEMNCIYCLTNQAHPRLARGETYTCGYKPYRCEVCNYSTTTKGNLSIHMQSDKHINNVQELQNGSIPPGSGGPEHMLQSQALAAAAAMAAATGPGASSNSLTPSGSNNGSNNGNNNNNSTMSSTKQNTGCSSSAVSSFGPTGSNASSPGLNPGEKVSPINTVPSGLFGPNQGGGSGSSSGTSGGGGKGKGTWRCDVCNYETGVARNLRIHMTSEKHTHNMVVLQQSVKHYQALSAMQQQAGLMAAMSGGDPMLAAAAQMHPGLLAALAAAAAAAASGPASGSSPVPSLPSPNHEPSMPPEAAIADMAYNHAVLLMQQQQQRAMAMMHHSQQGGNKPPFAGQPMVDMDHPDPSFRFDSVPYDDSSRQFQCCVCTVYSCDSIEALSQHIQSDRTRIREDEVLMAAGGNYICKLCSYKTSLKANFQLHCKTDKHLQRLQQVNHIKEGGSRSEWKLKYVNVSNPIQVRCNLCDYYTNSIHKLQLHSTNPRHESATRIFIHLQLSETILRTSQRDERSHNKSFYYYCTLCSFSTRTKINLVHHVNSIKHSTHELTRQQIKAASGQGQLKCLDEEIRQTFHVKELLPGDQINFGDNECQEHNDETCAPSSSSPSCRRRISSPTNGGECSPGSIEDLSMNASGQKTVGQSPPLSRPSSSGAMNAVAVSTAQGMTQGFGFESSFLKHALQEQERQAASLHSPQLRSQFDSGSHSGFGSQCPFCNYTSSSDVKMQLHLLTQHAKQQGERSRPELERPRPEPERKRLLCPLCQEAFEERIRLESHLMDIHNVTKEGVERLLTIVDTIVDTTGGDLGSSSSESKKRKMMTNDESDNGDGRSDSSSTDGRGEESIEQTAARFLKLGGGVPLAAVSDRHVYKYRCQQCSLAFKTKEKLQLHSQYHLIRAATQCVLCNRSFRSVEALQRHVEQVHRDMTEGEVESYRASLANNPFLGRNGTGILDPSTTELLLKESNRASDLETEEAMDLAMCTLDQDRMEEERKDRMEEERKDRMEEERKDRMEEERMNQESECGEGSGHVVNSLEDYLNSQAMAEDSYNDPSRKYKCHRCKVAFTRQSYLTAHNKTLLHRKGEKVDYPLEKYLDPNRPFKCEICKESFTQKNILLVHYNSVSHLHRSKQLKMQKEGHDRVTSDRMTSDRVTSDRVNSNSEAAVQSALLHSLTGSSVSPNESGSNPNALLFPPSSASPSSEEKKPFKCNICKVSYNLGSSLDIHIRSVLHQSRASKINELILMGQIDLSVPFIERGEESEQQIQKLTDRSSKESKVSPPKDHSVSPASSFPISPAEIQLQQQFQQQFALAAMAQASGIGQVGMGQGQGQVGMGQGQGQVGMGQGQGQGQGVFSCGRCGSMFPSQEIGHQHAQLCYLFGPPVPTTDPQIAAAAPRAPVLPTGQVLPPTPVGVSKFYSAPIHRTKPPIYKHLLETFGFEIVMQFNEQNQRKKKLVKVDSVEGMNLEMSQNVKKLNKEIENEGMVTETSVPGAIYPDLCKGANHTPITGDESQIDEKPTSENEISPEEDDTMNEHGSRVKSLNQSEMNKNETDGRMSENAREEKRQEILEEKRKEVSEEKRKGISGEEEKGEGSNLPEINRSVCNYCQKEFSSIWVLKAHKEEVHKEMVPFPVVESFAEEYRKEFEKKRKGGGGGEEGKGESNSDSLDISGVGGSSCDQNQAKRPTPSETPSVTDPHDKVEQLGGRSTPTTLSSSSQGNSSTLPQVSTSPPAGSNEAAAQLAAHMQFSQLLMNMGLAGMAVPGMVNNPFAAAAAMGILPQMIPLMMASGHLDPIMAAAAFNHQAAAAAQGLGPGQSPNPVSGPSPGPVDPLSFAAQQKMIAQQQQMAAAAQGKRARTRITDEQLKILRQYFDINNSPSEEALQEMSEKSGLPLKVIKHWFRNTLFKERQRNKDSPYNFNNPPSTFLNLEEYEKTGEAKIVPIDDASIPSSSKNSAIPSSNSTIPSSSKNSVISSSSKIPPSVEERMNHVQSDQNDMKRSETPKVTVRGSSSSNQGIKEEMMSSSDDDNVQRATMAGRQSVESEGQREGVRGEGREGGGGGGGGENQQQGPSQSSSQPGSLRESFDYAKSFSMSPHSESSISSISTNDTPSQNGDSGHHGHRLSHSQQAQMFAGLPAFAAAAGLPSLGNPLQMAIDAAQRSQSVPSQSGQASQPGQNRGQSDPQGSSPGSGSSGPGKRANRTRFTDYQIKVLQEFFEQNAYPKDDDLEYLSKLLNLSPRVIVVWFQNARQKARKVYENQPAAPEDETSQGRFQRTPGLNYQCKKCLQVFQRYYELIKHQKSACFKDENPLAAHLREARQSGSTSPGAVSGSNMSNHSSTTPTPDKNSSSPSANAFRCEKCSLVFPRFDLWREHQLVHLMNPNLFPAYPPTSPFGILQFEGQNATQNNPTATPPPGSVLASIMSTMNNNSGHSSAVAAVTPPSSQNKRKSSIPLQSLPLPSLSLPPPMDDDDEFLDEESFSGQGSQSGSVTGMDRSNETPRDKRLRTTILPEQLDYLYQKYQLESNPSRKMLENIAKEVGLKKRVVQVWFQNTRARERKGQFRAHQQVIHKRCPFCRALFKARSALESHLATRHADQYTKGDINIDALPDGEPDDMAQTPIGTLSTGNNGEGEKSSDLNDLQAKQWKRYMEEFAAAVPNAVSGIDGALPPELALTMRAALGSRLPGESTPLDLSKPVDLTRSLKSPFGPFGNFDGNGYDSHSDAGDEFGSDIDDNDDMMVRDDVLGETSPNSPTGAGSTNSSITGASPAAVGASGVPRNSTSSNSNKRFRTQMTTVQLKVMKSIFAEYKTPSMAECDSLGRDIGLPKRVIQVWFQNARAKEKKARLNYAKSFGHEMPEMQRSVDGCKVCSVKYNPEVASAAMQNHLFSKVHLENLKSHIDSNKQGSTTGNESADESVDYPGASMIVMSPNENHNTGSGPPSGDEAPLEVVPSPQVTQSQSVNNLMQLMGLAFSSSAMDGSNPLNNNGEQPTSNLNGGSRTPAFMANSFNMANHQQFKQPNL